ncbi:endosome/lysosome-associated apoptosis and autophagy regulator family member 2-like isoform X2 [Antedon mediterranea]|uniref:endosome/lysosome-associated apoptosis and autophagy regulator family member 2-like isoform X2 n=1 Tax=Antedon mediterranea TaxID=105859 RepID=UPI003AF9F75E
MASCSPIKRYIVSVFSSRPAVMICVFTLLLLCGTHLGSAAANKKKKIETPASSTDGPPGGAAVGGSSKQTLPTCQLSDFHFEYTECHSDGVRWRVSVPNPDTCENGGPPPPIRAVDCGFTCEAGQYLDVQNSQTCLNCAAGKYSLGGGQRFENWNKMPQEFLSLSEKVDEMYMESRSNCNESAWVPRNGFISSPGNDCQVSLVYSANLKKAGYVKFIYSYAEEDTIFHVRISNDQCQETGHGIDRWPDATGEGQWKEIKIDLSMGMNVISWKAIGMNFEDSTKTSPIRIKLIEINGLSYTSQCTDCPSGTYSDTSGSTDCLVCSANSFSAAGATSCTACPDTHYSHAGSSNCTVRQACKQDDYFQTKAPCNAQSKTKTVYKWIQPKICRSDITGATQLPSDSGEIDCPPCNPGMTFVNSSTCNFCPRNYYSNGINECKKCEGSTAPEYGMSFTSWNYMPPNMEATCLSMYGNGCATDDGWALSGNHIHSGQGHSDDVYLVLSVSTAGFRSKEGYFNGGAIEVGTVKFEFELQCVGDCLLFFLEEDYKSTVIESWEGAQNRTTYIYSVNQQSERRFTWAFQKADYDNSDIAGSKYRNDMAIIYSIEVKNTVDGGASYCKACPVGSDMEGCIPCPEGYYISNKTNKCEQCPPNTYLQNAHPYGEESCIPCGEGLKTYKNSVCYADCHLVYDYKHYDLTSLNGFHSVLSGASFSAKGTRFNSLFNISLCGNNGVGTALCKNNVTIHSEKTEDFDDDVKSLICRSTIIPSPTGENEATLSAQPVSIGDQLIGLNDAMGLAGITKSVFPESPYDIPDLKFYFHSSESTKACKNGRSTELILRCDKNADGRGVLHLPEKCPGGTCDGCTFHFLWMTAAACPECMEDDYYAIKGECSAGKQVKQYVWNSTRVCRDGVPLPEPITSVCSMIPWYGQLAIAGFVFSLLVLIVIVVVVWKQNKTLEYKYQKLVASASGELPAAETCAIGEDEEEDNIIFEDGKSTSFFSKLKSLGSSNSSDKDLEFSSMQNKLLPTS